MPLKPYELPCTPPRWARGGHAQTLLAHVLATRAPRLVPGRDGVTRHEVPLPGGDRLVALYRPGSSGVLAVNHRGCGEGRGLARGVYHSGRADDLGEVFAWSRSRFGSRALAVGFSLSGNALLLLLARGGRDLPAGAIAINPPCDLAGASARLSQAQNKLYDRRFVRRLSIALRERAALGLLPPGFELTPAKTLRDLDESVTAPLGGFRDAEDYYARCSTHELFDSIRTPTVVLSSADDPFVDSGVLRAAGSGTSVRVHIEASGGHVGYLAKSRGLFGHVRWLEGALQHYLGELERVSAPEVPA